MKIDFSSLKSAVAQLQKSYNYLHSDLAKDPDLREQFRSATIQAFEFTYELATKMIDRQLSTIVANPSQINSLNFNDRMRMASDASLVRDTSSYIKYRALRNETSHTYDVDKAENTVLHVGDFLVDMNILLEELQKRNP